MSTVFFYGQPSTFDNDVFHKKLHHFADLSCHNDKTTWFCSAPDQARQAILQNGGYGLGWRFNINKKSQGHFRVCLPLPGAWSIRLSFV